MHDGWMGIFGLFTLPYLTVLYPKLSIDCGSDVLRCIIGVWFSFIGCIIHSFINVFSIKYTR